MLKFLIGLILVQKIKILKLLNKISLMNKENLRDHSFFFNSYKAPIKRPVLQLTVRLKLFC